MYFCLTLYNGEKIAFSTNDAGKTGHQHAKNINRHRPFIKSTQKGLYT